MTVVVINETTVEVIQETIQVVEVNTGMQGATGPQGPQGPAGPQGAVGPAGTTDHLLLTNIGTTTHAQIDSHVANTSNPHATTKAQVGLVNVDNTSDINKPISTATQAALDLKVDENAAIVGATKTKITYDAKGLVTSGADATTADINDSLNRRYVTDADLVDLGNLSGTNTGDQSLSGLVPYTGASSSVDLGVHFLTAAQIATGAISNTLSQAVIDCDNFTLFDGAFVASVDFDARQLKKTDGVACFDWSNADYPTFLISPTTNKSGLFFAGGSVPYIEFDPASDNIVTGNANRFLFNNSFVSMNTIEDNSLFAAINLNTRSLLDPTGTFDVIDWNNKRVYLSAGVTVIDWSSLALGDASGLTSVNWGPRELNNTLGNPVLNWSDVNNAGDIVSGNGLYSININAATLTNNIANTLNWNTMQLIDSAASVASVGWGVRELYNSFATTVLAWGGLDIFAYVNIEMSGSNIFANVLKGNTISNSFGQNIFDLNSFTLHDGSNNVCLGTNSRQLISLMGAGVLDWSGTEINTVSIVPVTNLAYNLGGVAQVWSALYVDTLFDSAAVSAMSVTSRQLNDSGGNVSLNWSSRLLSDGSGTASIQYESRQLKDNGGAVVCNWNSKELYTAGGSTMLGWGSGNLVVSATVTTFPLGSQTAPSITFTGDTNTGIYCPIADNVAITTGGAIRFNVFSGAIESVGQVRAATGTPALPSFCPSSDTNSGLYGISDDVLGLSTDGVERMRLGATGNLGIGGTANTNAILDLQSTTKAFMPPRMTTTQKNAVASPTSGMVVYDSTLNKLCVRTAAAWETITSV